MNSVLRRTRTLGSATPPSFSAEQQQLTDRSTDLAEEEAPIRLTIDPNIEIQQLKEQIQQLLQEREVLLKQLVPRGDESYRKSTNDDPLSGALACGHKQLEHILGFGKKVFKAKETTNVILCLAFGVFSLISLDLVLRFATRVITRGPMINLPTNAPELTQNWIPKDVLRKLLEEK